jgi:hypothetical protein
MYQSVSLHQMADRDVQEFESDLKRYQAANKRSMWVGFAVAILALSAACLVCSAFVLLIFR